MAAGYDICYTVGIFAAQECLMYRTCSAAWDIVIATTISTLTRKNMPLSESDFGVLEAPGFSPLSSKLALHRFHGSIWWNTDTVFLQAKLTVSSWRDILNTPHSPGSNLHLHHGFAKPPLELKLLSSSNFLNFSSESFEAGVHFLGAALFLFYEQALLGWIEIVRLKIFHDEI
ncbi:hypothetical protein PC121_g12141 [Phytophthora cactorum]|nr:hypothetical protein PC121_g12141 [Phytophthora cactorum]